MRVEGRKGGPSCSRGPVRRAVHAGRAVPTSTTGAHFARSSKNAVSISLFAVPQDQYRRPQSTEEPPFPPPPSRDGRPQRSATVGLARERSPSHVLTRRSSYVRASGTRPTSQLLPPPAPEQQTRRTSPFGHYTRVYSTISVNKPAILGPMYLHRKKIKQQHRAPRTQPPAPPSVGGGHVKWCPKA